MSCWARNGTSDMYVSTNAGLRPLAANDAVLKEALDVFHGELTSGAGVVSFRRRRSVSTTPARPFVSIRLGFDSSRDVARCDVRGMRALRGISTS